MTLHVLVPGVPVVKARPRLGRRGKVYTPKHTLDYQHTVAWRTAAAMKAQGVKQFAGPVSVTVDLSFGPCKTAGAIPKGDIDNYVKGVLDGLNNVAFADDKQVVELIATKRYGDDASASILISEAA